MSRNNDNHHDHKERPCHCCEVVKEKAWDYGRFPERWNGRYCGLGNTYLNNKTYNNRYVWNSYVDNRREDRKYTYITYSRC